MICIKTDTDSLYAALARETVDWCVKPELMEEWKTEKYKMFTSDDKTPIEFAGREIPFSQYDRRTPGKFIIEFIGTGMVCLNSKIYHIWSDVYINGELLTKTSCKGIQKKRNPLTKEDFLGMIENPRKEHTVENAGFLRDGLKTRTYTQKKRGLNYFYIKRKVLSDGINTTHLDI